MLWLVRGRCRRSIKFSYLLVSDVRVDRDTVQLSRTILVGVGERLPFLAKRSFMFVLLLSTRAGCAIAGFTRCKDSVAIKAWIPLGETKHGLSWLLTAIRCEQFAATWPFRCPGVGALQCSCSCFFNALSASSRTERYGQTQQDKCQSSSSSGSCYHSF